MQKVLLFIVALILAGGAYLIYQSAPRLSDTSAIATSTPVQSSGENERTIAESTERYDIDVSYRRVGIPAIDAQIDAKVEAAVNAFKSDAAQAVIGDGFRKYTFQGEAAAVYTGGEIVSERIDLYQDTGGAHGLPIVMTLNYHAESGREVTLDEALALIGKSLGEVSAAALAQLNREFGATSVFADGAAARAENYQTFLVTPYNVVFIFQAYQVVAFAAGMPEVSFARL